MIPSRRRKKCKTDAYAYINHYIVVQCVLRSYFILIFFEGLIVTLLDTANSYVPLFLS